MRAQETSKITYHSSPRRRRWRSALIIPAVFAPLLVTGAAGATVLAPRCGGLTQADAVAAGYVVFYDAVGADDHVVGAGTDDDWIMTRGGEDLIESGEGEDII